MQLRPEVLPLCLKGSEVQRKSPYIFSVVSGDSDEKTSYFVLLESVRPDDERICNAATELLRVLLTRNKGSLTASISASLKETHQRLYHFNQQRPSPERSGLGVTCLALKGMDVFVGSAGPSLAYLLQGDQLRQISNPKEGGLASVSGIGTASKAEVQLFYHTLEPGDTIFLATSSLRRGLSERGLLALLTQNRNDYNDSLRQLSGPLPYLSTIRVDLFSQEQTHKTKRSLTAESGAAVARAVTKVRLPNLTGKKKNIAVADNGNARLKQTRTAKLREAVGQLLPAKEELPFQKNESQSKSGKPSAAAGKAIKANPSALLRKLRMPLAICSVFLALLIGVQLILLYPSFANKQTEASFSTLLVQAQKAYDAAMDKDDKADRRRLLLDADNLASAALEKRKDDPRAVEIRQSISFDLNILNGVFSLPGLRLLEDYGRIGANNPAKLFLNEESVFVLDKGNDRVYASTLNSGRTAVIQDSTKVLLKKDDKYGGTTVSALNTILWMSPGGARSTANLLALDDRYSIFEYAAGKGISLLKVRGAGAWASFRGALGYNGNLYVLDPRANQVWRYIPTSSGYDSERRGILENAEIPEAIDFAIDGNVYILNSAGTIWKFTSGVQQTLSQAGIDKKMVSPISLYTSAEARYVYAVDSGNRRIVVFTKSGAFYRQYSNEAFDNLRNIYVDEEKARIYILNGKKVYSATLPK